MDLYKDFWIGDGLFFYCMSQHFLTLVLPPVNSRGRHVALFALKPNYLLPKERFLLCHWVVVCMEFAFANHLILQITNCIKPNGLAPSSDDYPHCSLYTGLFTTLYVRTVFSEIIRFYISCCLWTAYRIRFLRHVLSLNKIIKFTCDGSDIDS